MKKITAVQWKAFDSNSSERDSVCDFATGEISFTELRSRVYTSDARKEFSKLRKHGSVKSKKLARRAVARNWR